MGSHAVFLGRTRLQSRMHHSVLESEALGTVKQGAVCRPRAASGGGAARRAGDAGAVRAGWAMQAGEAAGRAAGRSAGHTGAL